MFFMWGSIEWQQGARSIQRACCSLIKPAEFRPRGMDPARLSAAQPCQRRLVQARRLFFGVIPFAGLVFSVVHAAAAAPPALAGAFGIRRFRRCIAAAPQRAARHKSDEKQGKAISAQGLNGHFPTQQKMLWPFYRREGASTQFGLPREEPRRGMMIAVSPCPPTGVSTTCQGRSA